MYIKYNKYKIDELISWCVIAEKCSNKKEFCELVNISQYKINLLLKGIGNLTEKEAWNLISKTEHLVQLSFLNAERIRPKKRRYFLAEGMANAEDLPEMDWLNSKEK